MIESSAELIKRFRPYAIGGMVAFTLLFLGLQLIEVAALIFG